MNRTFLQNSTLLTFMIISTASHAFEIGKQSTSSTATVTKATLKNAVGTKKEVTLMDVHLAPEEQRYLFRNLAAKINVSTSTNDLPSTVNLGMNNVPVLDQGSHGTCVTFASTAALDAVLGKGDYISQLL